MAAEVDGFPFMDELDAIKTCELALRENVTPDSREYSAFSVLAFEVFEQNLGPDWPALTIVDRAGRCVAGLQHAVLVLRINGVDARCVAIRNVAVAADWRGRGLMSGLFARLLPWCAAQAPFQLLFAENAALYTRFGFASLPQHAFEADAPEPLGPATARRMGGAPDDGLVAHLLSARAPLSERVFLAEDGGLTAHALRRTAASWFHDATLETAFRVEHDGAVLVLADVVGPRIPSAARVLGALGVRPTRLRTLFPPDRLAWTGDPVVEDAGLMIRGRVPDALLQPFCLPPTVEF